jgi:membrane associated rhomboid family serine protease
MKSFYLIAGFVALIWAIELLNFATGHAMDTLGLLPREPSGLIGIPLSPLLHGSFGHVALNTLPLIVLGGFVAIEGRRRFLQLSALVIVVGGSALWVLGRSAYHVGASGLIFGYFGYLLARGWYERSIGAIAVALLTLVLYGSMLWGVLPTQPYVSWEGHLFGLGAGVLAARLMRRERAAEEGPVDDPLGEII